MAQELSSHLLTTSEKGLVALCREIRPCRGLDIERLTSVMLYRSMPATGRIPPATVRSNGIVLVYVQSAINRKLAVAGMGQRACRNVGMSVRIVSAVVASLSANETLTTHVMQGLQADWD